MEHGAITLRQGVDQRTWHHDAYDVFRKHAFRHIAYVPDAGLAKLIELCHSDSDLLAVSLTTEEEGIGLLTGAWLGGERGALLMQSSGVGNCINALSMIQQCRIPFLSLVTMRGEWAEFNPWQVAMGQAVRRTLESMGVIVYAVGSANEVGDTLDAAAQFVSDSDVAAAVLVSQCAIGRKHWK